MRDETGFYMHNPKHPKAKEWADRLEEIYISGEVWTYAENKQADQYTMAYGRESFKDCKQMDLMIHPLGLKQHPKYPMTRFERAPVLSSPLCDFLDHLKGARKQT